MLLFKREKGIFKLVNPFTFSEIMEKNISKYFDAYT